MNNTRSTQLDVAAAVSTLQSIETLDLRQTSVDDIKDLLSPAFRGFIRSTPSFQPGMNLFSACIGPKPTNVADAMAFSASDRNRGPANRDGEPMLYCGTSRQAAIFELEPKVDDTVILVHWKTTAPMLVNHVGYTPRAFASLGSNRPVVRWGNEPPLSYEHQQQIEDLLADLFTKVVPVTDRDRHRKLTVAIAERLFEHGLFDGLLYPSVRMRANGDVIALKPGFVQERLQFVKAELIRIDGSQEFSFDVTVVDTALDLAQDGTIRWLKISSRDGKQSAARYGTFGWKQFLQQKRAILKVYDSAKQESADRPVHTEHGPVAEACLRRWLLRYLPSKYGVTSGYIIPDVRTIDYTLRHYDVIVFDRLNSPVLWASENPDESDLGTKRAIPAQHVFAVLEVKSTFTRASINGAMEKLRELNDYMTNLPDRFVSSVVFFELMTKEQSKCDLAEGLFSDEIPGYFGGIILRAEGFDEDISGYFLTAGDGSDTVGTMPLIREIGSLLRDENGNPQLTVQGDAVLAFSGEGVWHFDKGYCPIVRNVELTWSYNGFPRFCLDLLERLEGEFDPARSAKHGAYGMSFLK